MIKNIIIVILSIFTLIAMLFAYSQKIRAEHAEEEAIINHRKAAEQAEIARIEKLAADSAKVIANVNRQVADSIAVLLLEERNKSKKFAEWSAKLREEATANDKK